MKYIYKVDMTQTYYSYAEVCIKSNTPLSKETIEQKATDKVEFDGISDCGECTIDNIKEIIK